MDRPRRSCAGALMGQLIDIEKESELEARVVQRRAHRAVQTPDERAAARSVNAEQHRAQRAALDPDERAAERSVNAEQHWAQRAALDPDERAAVRQADAEQHQAARNARAALDPAAMFQHDALAACLMLWSMARPPSDEQVDQLLEPISKPEADALVAQARQNIDPHSFIAGCATCGEVIIKHGGVGSAPNELTLAELVPRYIFTDI